MGGGLWVKSKPPDSCGEQPSQAGWERDQQHETGAGGVPSGTPWWRKAPSFSRKTNKKDSPH